MGRSRVWLGRAGRGSGLWKGLMVADRVLPPACRGGAPWLSGLGRVGHQARTPSSFGYRLTKEQWLMGSS